MTRLAAFVFTELAEASATLASLGEERSQRARRAYFDVVRSAVAVAEGRELATAGDGVLAAFESSTDALSFANAVQRGCERESRRVGERLDVRVGIDVGETTGDEGTDAQGAEAAARAQELARAARSGGVLATGTVVALGTGADAGFSPVGLLDLLGANDPVSAFEVSWERPPVVQVPLPAALEGVGQRTLFVGRTQEIERLQAVWQAAVGGERQLAFVVGEPGIGKTRLVDEFARGLHEQGAAVLWGRSSEEALAPYQPFVQALQHHVRNATLEELRAQIGAAGRLLGRLVPELQLRLPAPARESVGEPESERYRLFEAVGSVLATAAAERPMLLVLDDLQWADQGTLLLLKHLARDPVPAPLLLLGTYRDSEVGRDHPLALMRADVERDRIVERIALSGLKEEEIRTFVGSLIGWQPPAEVARNLHSETDGNPFFLEEVVRHFAQLGLTADPEQLAGANAAGRGPGVPARVRELVARRVQRLSRSAQAALAAGAVIGSELDRDVLAAVLTSQNEHDLVAALDEAVEAALLTEVPDRVGRYRFSHALIQQALYEEQTVNRRASLHEQVAAALEGLQRAQGHAELAYHYARAGDRYAADVVRNGRAAAEEALTLFAYEDAAREVSAALEALDHLAENDPVERAELLTLLGTARTRCGAALEARAAFREAAGLAAAAGAWQTLARAALGYGGGTNFGGIWETVANADEELFSLLEQALEAGPSTDSRERVRLLGRLAQALYWTPENDRALQLSDEAVAAARRLGDRAALAYALDSRRVALWGPDHLDAGRALAEEMLVLGRELEDGELQLEALAWLITDALERGSIAVVDALIAEHGRLAGERRLPYHLWFTETLHVMRAHLDGRLAEADELCERAYAHGAAFALSAQGHGGNALQVYLAQALFLWLDQGRAEELLDKFRSRGSAWPPSILRAGTALCLTGLDGREEALEHVAPFAKQGFDSIPRDALWMMTMVALCRTVAHFDEPTYADELYELLLPYADRIFAIGGAIICLGPGSWLLGMLARAAGRPDVALTHLADALERSQGLGSPPLIARTQLEMARAHLLRHGADDPAVAERLLDEAGATASTLRMRRLSHDIELVRSSLRQGTAA